MKYLFIAFFLLSASTAQGSTFYGNTGYERRVRVACERAAGINTASAKQCFSEVVEIHRQQELIDSQIELNKAKTKWLKDDNRLRYQRRFDLLE